MCETRRRFEQNIVHAAAALGCDFAKNVERKCWYLFLGHIFGEVEFLLDSSQGIKKLKSISTFKAPKIDFLWRVVNFPGLGFTLAEPQTGIIVKSWFGVLSHSL